MISELAHHLSKRDIVEVLHLSHQSLACANQDDLKRLVLDLKKLFYFENTTCAQGNVLELIQDDQEPDIDVCDINYPPGYLELYFENEFYFSDAVFCEFITHLSPVNWDDVDKKCNFNYPASVLAIDFNMKDGWTHGTVDLNTMNSTVFFFGGPSSEHSTRIENILEYIIPFYSEAYKRVLNKASQSDCVLSEREIEVLNWIKEGKSSWEISIILNCSKRNIDFHVSNIKKKLNAVSRAQAVAIGIHHRIITL